MEKKNLIEVLFLVAVLSCAHAATTQTLTVSTDAEGKTFDIWEGEDVSFNVKVSCLADKCKNIELYPYYCLGQNCTSPVLMMAQSSPQLLPDDPAFSRLDIPFKWMDQPRGNYIVPWTIHVRKSGFYEILFFAAASKESAQSGRLLINASGCGDALCEGTENLTSCPQDCCDPDCTSSSDEICHAECNGYNGCSIVKGCDGSQAGFAACVSKNAYISCCTGGMKLCGSWEYCGEASCLLCSDECDAFCQSPACFGRDPDCTEEGKAAMPCCGNARIEDGEECDTARGSCPLGCDSDCRCATTTTRIPTTTTSSTLEETTTTLPEETTTSSAPSSATTLETKQPASSQFPAETLAAAAAVLLIAAGLFLFVKKGQGSGRMRAEHERLTTEKQLIEKAIRLVKEDYASDRISESDAQTKILAYEKELALNVDRIEYLEHKLGLKSKKKVAEDELSELEREEFRTKR